MRNALAPPPVPVLFHCGEIVKTVAPYLPLRRKRVGRHSRHGGRTSVLVQLKIGRVRPDVHALRRHIKRQVSDDAHAACVHLGFQLVPLAVEFVLLEDVIIYLCGEFFPCCGEGFGVAEGKPLFPFRPVEAVTSGKRHKQRIVVQPITFLIREFGYLLPISGFIRPKAVRKTPVIFSRAKA